MLWSNGRLYCFFIIVTQHAHLVTSSITHIRLSFHSFISLSSTMLPVIHTQMSPGSCLLTPLSLIFVSQENIHTSVNTRPAVNSRSASTHFAFRSNNEVVKVLSKPGCLCDSHFWTHICWCHKVQPVWVCTSAAWRQKGDLFFYFVPQQDKRWKLLAGVVMTLHSVSPDGSCLCISGVHS